MVKTIREVAVIGISDIAVLSDDDPVGAALVAAEGAGLTASRDDHAHPSSIPASAGEPAALYAGMLYVDSSDSYKIKYVESPS
jgi:hypothetical protein